MNDIGILLPHLISPESKQELEYEKSTQTFHDRSTGRIYRTMDGIPLLLPEKEKEGLKIPDIILKHNSTFRYLDHYRKDAELFDYLDPGLNKSNMHEQHRLHQTILRQMPGNAGLILDVGCGSGWLASHVKRAGKKLCSMDISTVNPGNAIRNHSFPGHAAVVADVYHLPFRENTFDCIVASEIMEHTVDPAEFIKELIHVLKPGGKAIITTPYNEKIENTLCVHCNKPTPLNAHLHSFNENNIRPAVESIRDIRFRTKKFSNKMLISLRTYILMQFSCFPFWKFMDDLANLVYKNPTRFMIIIEKVN